MATIKIRSRADIAKCEGGDFEYCGSCVRKLAPTAPRQVWTVPIENKQGACALFAPTEKYGHLYGGING
jgi:hypothetical protein